MAPKKGIRFFTFSNLICFRITESRPKKTDRYRRSLSDVHHVSGAKTQTQIDWHNGTRTQVPIGNPYRFFFMKEGASAPEREFRLASWNVLRCRRPIRRMREFICIQYVRYVSMENWWGSLKFSVLLENSLVLPNTKYRHHASTRKRGREFTISSTLLKFPRAQWRGYEGGKGRGSTIRVGNFKYYGCGPISSSLSNEGEIKVATPRHDIDRLAYSLSIILHWLLQTSFSFLDPPKFVAVV